jgi:hypothetical protein
MQMLFNHNQPNYGSGVQNGFNSPHMYPPNIPNPNFQTFYRPQMSPQYYPMNSAGQPVNQFVPTTYQPLNRPIFSIPAPRGISFSPNSHIAPTQIVSNYPSRTMIPQAHYISSNPAQN